MLPEHHSGFAMPLSSVQDAAFAAIGDYLPYDLEPQLLVLLECVLVQAAVGNWGVVGTLLRAISQNAPERRGIWVVLQAHLVPEVAHPTYSTPLTGLC